jgi:sarcosine oxidase
LPAALVVGAGVFGAALADHLIARGWEVTLVEQFEPGDERSESGGETRMLRYSHGPDGFYAALAWRAREQWLELGVLEEVGVIWFARREGGWESESERVLSEQGIPVERAEPSAVARLYPSLRVDDLAFGLLEPAAGVLRAGDGVRALVERARGGGLRVERGEALPDGERVAVDGQLLEADHVVWACGPWLGGLFPGLADVRATKQDVLYFGAAKTWRTPGVPGWVDYAGAFYGLGDLDGRGVKVSTDAVGPEFDPDTGDRELAWSMEQDVRRYLQRRFPALRDAPLVGHRSCQYELTPDNRFLAAPHPAHPSVWVLGGGSGHGFKHGPALAERMEAWLGGTELPEPMFAFGDRTVASSLSTTRVDPRAVAPEAS